MDNKNLNESTNAHEELQNTEITTTPNKDNLEEVIVETNKVVTEPVDEEAMLEEICAEFGSQTEEDLEEDEEYDESDDFEGYIPPKPQKNKFLNIVGVCAIAACFGLLGGFVGANINVSTDKPTSNQTYYINAATVSKDNVSDLNDVSDIVNNTMPAIVSITATLQTEYYYGFSSQYYETPSAGSGVIYSQSEDELLVVTNYHVIENSKDVTVGWVDGTTSPAKVEGFSKPNDIALLKVSLEDINETTLERLKVVVLGDSDKCKVGEGTIAIGNALGYGQTVTAGIVSALNRTVNFSDGISMNMMQTSAAINPGNSGGALLNGKGELIGINSAKYSDTDVEGIGYAIPVNNVISVVSDILAGESTSSATGVTLGITGYDITAQMAQSYNMPIGVCIQFVESNSMAELNGLKPGDIITKADDTVITSINELKNYLNELNEGDTVDFTINRPSNNAYDEFVIDITFKTIEIDPVW